MGMNAILCALSPKRLALLEEDPEVLEELLAARRETEIPGLLDLGKPWHALDVLLGEGKHAVLGDTIVGRSGIKLKPELAFGPPRLIDAKRVAQIAAALEALPATYVRDRYPSLFGKTVHGNYGQDRAAADDKVWLRAKVAQQTEAEIAELTGALAKVTALYRTAAKAGHAMLSVIV